VNYEQCHYRPDSAAAVLALGFASPGQAFLSSLALAKKS
jgi:hypothetical protein